MTPTEDSLGPISRETFRRLPDSEKMNVLFDVVSSTLEEHTTQISRLKRRKHRDSLFSGLCGLIGGAVTMFFRELKP